MTARDCSFGPYVFDAQRSVLLKHGTRVRLGRRAAAILDVLLAAEGRPVPKSVLLEKAWSARTVEDSNLPVQIAALRKSLGRTRLGGEWIETVQGVGYQFVFPDGVKGAASSSMADEPERPSIAVLPFNDESTGPGEGLLGDALTGDIIAGLTRWRLLSVRSRSATARFRGARGAVEDAARELNAGFVVEGSVLRTGKDIRIRVHLVDARTGNEVWGERFDRPLEDFFVIQDQVVQSIVSTLVGRVEAALSLAVSRKHPAKLAAYECLLKGNALSWNDPGESAEAARLFARAIEIDPTYAAAYAVLAIMRCRDWQDDWNGPDDLLEEAHGLTRRAVELDPAESTGFALLAHTCSLRRSYDLALEYGRRAVEMNPYNQWNAADLGLVLIRSGEPEEAIACFRQARGIDPYFDPPWYWYGLGLAHMLIGRFGEAAAFLERVLGESYWNSALLAGCHARLGAEEAARHSVAECLRLRPDFSVEGRIARERFKFPRDARRLAACLSLLP